MLKRMFFYNYPNSGVYYMSEEIIAKQATNLALPIMNVVGTVALTAICVATGYTTFRICQVVERKGKDWFKSSEIKKIEEEFGINTSDTASEQLAQFACQEAKRELGITSRISLALEAKNKKKEEAKKSTPTEELVSAVSVAAPVPA
jgi:hypothetical protein